MEICGLSIVEKIIQMKENPWRFGWVSRDFIFGGVSTQRTQLLAGFDLLYKTPGET
jgi:hypothetical protein